MFTAAIREADAARDGVVSGSCRGNKYKRLVSSYA